MDSDIWYYSRPMGENTIGQLMQMAAKECGLGRKTNHSVCKSCVQSLRKAGVARDKIKHVTGHKSTLSIEAYDDKLSDDEQMEFSDILTNNSNRIDTNLPDIGNPKPSSSTVSATCTTVALPEEQVLQNVHMQASTAVAVRMEQNRPDSG